MPAGLLWVMQCAGHDGAHGGMCAQVFAVAALLWATGERIAFCIARRHPPLHKAANALQVVSSSRGLQKALRCREPHLAFCMRMPARPWLHACHTSFSCSTLFVAC